jgi:queuine/archaeosine tRNA-ribosyltransferase
MAVAHGVDQSSMVDYVRRLIDKGRPHVIAVPWRDLKRSGYSKAFSALKALSEVTKPQSKLHVLAAGSVTEWPFIYACGADTIDSTTWAHKLLDPDSLVWKDPTRNLGLNCTCEVCKNRKTALIERNPSVSSSIYNHNLTIMNQQINEISEAMTRGTISDLAREVNPNMYKEHGAFVFKGDAR